MAVTQAEQAEHPPPVLMVGQNSQGNWVVKDQHGVCGGLFVNRDAALQFVRAVNGCRPQAAVMVSADLELDPSGHNDSALIRRESGVDLEQQRRIA